MQNRIVRLEDKPDMRDIVELGDDCVEEFWTSKAVLGLDLRRKVAQDDDSGLVWANED